LFLTFRGLLSSKLLALYISKGLKILSQHKRVLSFIKSSIEYFYNLYKNQFFLKIRGFKLSLKGRINGSTRFKTALMLYGQLNIPRFNNFIDYSYVPILTKYGILGLKIYLNKLVFNKKIYAIKTKKNKIFKFSQAFMKKKQKAFTLFTKISKY
jgi:ribosomal protein S3